MDKREELSWIYQKLKSTPDVYLLGDVLEYKEYCSDEVHEWGREDELYRIYGKVRDLLQKRILEAMRKYNLEKSTGETMLKVLYYKEYEQRLEDSKVRQYQRMDNIVYDEEKMVFDIGNHA